MRNIFKKTKKETEKVDVSAEKTVKKRFTIGSKNESVETLKDLPKQEKSVDKSILDVLLNHKEGDGWMHFDRIHKAFEYSDKEVVEETINSTVANSTKPIVTKKTVDVIKHRIAPYLLSTTLDLLLKDCFIEYSFGTHSYRITDLGKNYLKK